jgi:ERCC4-type nuclease
MPEIINIFSKNPESVEKDIEMPVIIADHREKNSLVISELVSLGIQVKFEQLEVADFLVRNIAIERKTVSDFISSMMNKRLSEQLINMQQYENNLLLIEGIEEQELYSSKDNDLGVNPNAIRGFLLDILLKYKVPIIFTKNFQDTAKFLWVLSRKKPSDNESLRAKRKTLNIDEQRQFILEGFPSIGAKTAKKLLREFGSLKNIINAPELELKRVIGKKSESFKQLLD